MAARAVRAAAGGDRLFWRGKYRPQAGRPMAAPPGRGNAPSVPHLGNHAPPPRWRARGRCSPPPHAAPRCPVQGG